MNTAEFVVKISNPYFSDYPVSQISENQMKSAINFAVKKKIFPLFYEGCLKKQIKLPKEAETSYSYFRLHQAKQVEAAKLLCKIQDDEKLDLIFFKTFRPFNYIPDDVDILLRDEGRLDILMARLTAEKYFLHNVGTPEIGLRKIEKDAYVDLDIHKRLAVGSLVLFEAENLWQNNAFEQVHLSSDCSVFKLSEDYEVVREAAYSLLKDFHLSIAGFYLGLNALLNRNLKVIQKIAVKNNFHFHLQIYLSVVYSLAVEYFKEEAIERLKFSYSASSDFLLPLCRNLKMPYHYPFPVIVWAYLYKASLEINRNKNLTVIPQIMKQPASKGIKVLIDTIRERLH